MRISLVILLLFMALTLFAETKQYADFLYQEGQYAASILEYNRFLYSDASSTSDSLYAISQIVRAYSNAGFFDEAAMYLRKSGLEYKHPDNAKVLKANLLLKKGEPRLAKLVCENATSDTLKVLKGTSELYLNLPDEAKRSFQSLELKRDDLVKIADDLKRVPTKNPYMAATLAIVPGLGYAYCGKYQTAISAFALHAAIFASAWELNEQKLPITSLLVALSGTGFYLGSIYGSISEAQKYNEHNRKTWLDGRF